MKSDILSAIVITVTLMFALTHSGMIEASTTLKFLMPWTFPVWSTTELGSYLGPILFVQEIWCPVVTSSINQESNDLSDCKSESNGVNRSCIRDDMSG